MAVTYEDALARYPEWAWAFNLPEVGDLLKRGLEEAGFNPIPAILQTAWYKGTQASMRQWDALMQSDPASAHARLRETEAQIWDQQLKMGLPADPQFARDMALRSQRLGWEAAQLQDALGGALQYKTASNTAGDVNSIKNQIKTNAAQYFVKLSDETAWNYARSVVAGEQTTDDWNVVFRRQAQADFPHVAETLDRGITMEQLYAPRKERMAALLEIGANDIDLMSPEYSKVLGVPDEKGGTRVPTFNEVDTMIRSTDKWKKTKNGQESALEVYDTLAKTFGKVAS